MTLSYRFSVISLLSVSFEEFLFGQFLLDSFYFNHGIVRNINGECLWWYVRDSP